MKSIIFSILGSLCLSGCYTLYQGPSSGPTAELRVLRNANFRHNAETYKIADSCSDRIIIIPIADAATEKTVTVAAGKAFSYSFGIDLGVTVTYPNVTFHGCSPTATFTPEAGAVYETWPEIRDGACHINLERIDGVNRVATPYRPREWQRPFSSSGSFCKPL